ncbi:hypothetical protein Ddye_011901 [Dipteronia dyeriana]|uniref:MADS-box domain-containing protein n=1 Tax=Dipteronia dyeriana TaxID=168575 RepID=A0AAE0CHU9_9ROSI|nr:hypothetical protein Ddye_011901 [Dipteronia dyeriana]
MVRKKMTLARIADDNARKASLKKRSCGLMKKVYELTILCGTSASVIIYNPDDKQLMMWPSHTEALKILTRFFSMPEMQQKKKMNNQETYLGEKVSKMQEQLKKYQRKHREIEIFNLMQYVDQGNDLDKLNVNDLKSLVRFGEEKRKEIRKRVEYCQQIHLFPSFAFAPDPPPMVVLDQIAASIRDNIGGLDHDHHGKALAESTQWDQWFTNMNNNSDNIVGSSKMSKTGHMAGLSADMVLPSKLFRGNIIASDIGLHYDVTEEWHTNFNP